MKTMFLTLVLLAGGVLGGCGHELFADANNNEGRERSLGRFYDEDSAVQVRASRQKANDMGFGYPAGILQQ